MAINEMICKACGKPTMKLKTIEIETGNRKDKLIKVVGVCPCGFQAVPNPSRWNFK